MLSRLRRCIFRRKPQKVIDLPVYGVIECRDCHQYLRTGFALSLIGHLKKHHKMVDNDAIEVGTHMLDLFYAAKIKMRQESGD